jgi:mRNA interferase HicA
MKRRDFLGDLALHGCSLLREGARHSNHNPRTGAVSSVPRHAELSDFLARKICRDFDIALPD